MARTSDRSIPSRSKGPPPLPQRPAWLPNAPVYAWPAARVQPYAWQTEALSAWRSQGCRGVVEAVTGTGKTVVGLIAAAEAFDRGGKVQILVPSIELLRQWSKELRRYMPRAVIGQQGDGSDAGLITSDVLVSVVNSARRVAALTVPPESLLIADECHRYGSDGNAKALNVRFDRRLGLSATYARSDDGNAAYLDPYFGSTCYRLGYARAISDNITAHFKVALVAVRFGQMEELAYKEASRQASHAREGLLRAGIREQPFGEFMKSVSELAEGGLCRSDIQGAELPSELPGEAADPRRNRR